MSTHHTRKAGSHQTVHSLNHRHETWQRDLQNNEKNLVQGLHQTVDATVDGIGNGLGWLGDAIGGGWNAAGEGLAGLGDVVNQTSKTVTGGHWDGPIRDEYHVGFFTIQTGGKKPPPAK